MEGEEDGLTLTTPTLLLPQTSTPPHRMLSLEHGSTEGEETCGHHPATLAFQDPSRTPLHYHLKGNPGGNGSEEAGIMVTSVCTLLDLQCCCQLRCFNTDTGEPQTSRAGCHKKPNGKFNLASVLDGFFPAQLNAHHIHLTNTGKVPLSGFQIAKGITMPSIRKSNSIPNQQKIRANDRLLIERFPSLCI